MASLYIHATLHITHSSRHTQDIHETCNTGIQCPEQVLCQRGATMTPALMHSARKTKTQLSTEHVNETYTLQCYLIPIYCSSTTHLLPSYTSYCLRIYIQYTLHHFTIFTTYANHLLLICYLSITHLLPIYTLSTPYNLHTINQHVVMLQFYTYMFHKIMPCIFSTRCQCYRYTICVLN
jgi:hypothetical protein